jgi:hypothetical protein
MADLRLETTFALDVLDNTTMNSVQPTPLPPLRLPEARDAGQVIPVAVHPATLLHAGKEEVISRNYTLGTERFAGQVAVLRDGRVQLDLAVVPPVSHVGRIVQAFDTSGTGPSTVFVQEFRMNNLLASQEFVIPPAEAPQEVQSVPGPIERLVSTY